MNYAELNDEIKKVVNGIEELTQEIEKLKQENNLSFTEKTQREYNECMIEQLPKTIKALKRREQSLRFRLTQPEETLNTTYDGVIMGAPYGM